MIIAVIIAGAACAGMVALTAMLARERRRAGILEALVNEKEAEAKRSAKLLIDKNIELIDRQLAEKRLMESRVDFIAIISHQLRTPVTEVKWGLASLFDAAGAYRAPERGYAERLLSGTTQLEKLIDTLLRFVNAEEVSGVIAALPYDPDEIIRQTALETARHFTDKHIALGLNLDFKGTITSIDQGSLDMVAANLIENAFYYTPAGGHITVESSRGKDGAFMASVTDTGVGIPESRQSSLFSKIDRSPEAIAAHQEGSGLGLYTVKRVLERCGGTIAFESAEGKGSTFRFTLPARGARA